MTFNSTENVNCTQSAIYYDQDSYTISQTLGGDKSIVTYLNYFKNQ